MLWASSNSTSTETSAGKTAPSLDALPVLDLPSDRPRPKELSSQGDILSERVCPFLVASLRELAIGEDATLSMVLLAAFQILLHRYTSQEDLVVGSVVAKGSEQEEVTGLPLNTLVLRTDLAGNPPFRELLGRVRQVTLAAHAHQDLPFERFQETLRRDPGANHASPCQVMFVHRNARQESQDLPGMTAMPADVGHGTSRFDLTMFSCDDLDGLEVAIEFRTDLFDRDRIERMLGHFRTLLERVVANPDERIGYLPLLTDEEQRQLLVEWNDTGTDYPRDKCIHQLFEEQVERTPNAVAVVFEGQELTYRELNEQANRLAGHLRNLGVERETLVAICVERSLEMVVGLLGILKAGGAYVPLDPAYPEQRLAFMLQDTEAPVLLTQERFGERLPAYEGKTVCLDRLDEFGLDEGCENLPAIATAESLAYVIYTSGSTGQPKGVMIEHRGVVNLATWHQRQYGVSALDRATLLASTAFDASVWELWPYVTVGAAVRIVPDKIRSNVECLPSWLSKTETTICFMPTPLAEAVLDGPHIDELPLRYLLTGGDRLRPGSHGGHGFCLVNHYGPTENSVVSTFHPIGTNVAPEDFPPIGRPIANTQAYVLDQHLQPVPMGVPGQLCVAGAGLARGYLKRPDVNAEHFVSNPFAEAPGARLYCTGDCVRWNVDGSLQFLGRMDQQVKIRGFRIEPGEIEAALNEHPLVNDVAVIAREDTPGVKRLVAYLVCGGQEQPTVTEFRRTLAAQLPEYMIPEVFVFLNALPLNANGKIDRRSLPAPEQLRPNLETDFVGPRNEQEQTLVRVWQDILGTDTIGVHDNFFELGGHSLQATRVASWIRTHCQASVSPTVLFSTPTIAELVEFLEGAGSVACEAPSPINRVPREGPLALSSAQQRLWLLHRLGMGGRSYNIPLAYRFDGPLDASLLSRCLQELVNRHESLRTVFREGEGDAVQEVQHHVNAHLELQDLTGLSTQQCSEEVTRWIKTEAHRQFDLATGPLFRTRLLRLSEREYVFVLIVHHIVFDGWSEGVFFNELRGLYAAFSRNQPSPLAELPIQYVDFAAWQKEQLESDAQEEELAYWQEQLAGAPPVLELPADRPRPNEASQQGNTISEVFSSSLVAKLKELANGEEATLYMTLLAAFKVLLYRYTSQEDLVVGSVVANRNRRELEELIGFFVNTLALRTDLSGSPSFRELLQRVRQVTLDAYAHQELPFDRLVEVLQPERSLSHSPLFQVMFVHQNYRQDGLELPGLKVTPVDVEHGTSKFDLTMFTYDEPDGLKVAVEYSTDLFDRDRIERLLGHFRMLLEGIVADPDERIGYLPLLTEQERHQLLVEWNDTKTDYPRDKCIHQLFEEQVERTPDAVAVVFEGEELTYRQLNEQANRLAWHLQSLGVKHETLVAICVERSLEMAVGLLGILKAGGAYVPLDPTYPEQRLAFMLQDTQAPVLLTQERLRSRLPDYDGRTAFLDRIDEVCQGEDGGTPTRSVSAESLAYVMYTSGSTGQPKGTSVPHCGVVRLVIETNYIQLGPEETILQYAPLAFDASTLEIWGALLNGGRLSIYPPGLSSREELVRHIRTSKVTTLWLTAGLFHQLEDNHLSELTGVRQLLTGGDVVLPGRVLAALKRLPSTCFINGYGPTENTTFTCCHGMTSPNDVGDSVSIGRPIANTRVYVVDRNLQLVPIGVSGELCTSGDGLAREYFHCPELTRKKFVPNPFDSSPGDRIYRTGDHVRWQRDGTLEFLGRMDQQVKIRGFRIELGEVEAALNEHVLLDDVAVVAREDTLGAKRLVAYVVRADQEQPTITELRRSLSERLPDYMIPDTFVFLDALPLNANGKLDRKNLPAPDQSRPDLKEAFVAPRTELEEALAEIWCDILGTDQIGIHDNFFEMGGHSLWLIRLATRVQALIGRDISIGKLYELNTIANQAEFLSAESSTNQPCVSSLLRLRGGDAKPPLIFMPDASGHPFIDQSIIDNLPGDQPIYAVRLATCASDATRLIALKSVAAECAAVLARSAVKKPFVLVGYSYGGLVAYELACQLKASGQPPLDAIVIDTGPSPSRNTSLLHGLQIGWWFAKNLPWWFYQNMADDKIRHQLKRSLHFCKYLWQRCRGRSPEMCEEKWRASHEIMSNDRLTTLEKEIMLERIDGFFRYQPPPYPGHVTVFCAHVRPLYHSLEPDLGWRSVDVGTLDIVHIPGNHTSILRPPHSNALAKGLTAVLERLDNQRSEADGNES